MDSFFSKKDLSSAYPRFQDSKCVEFIARDRNLVRRAPVVEWILSGKQLFDWNVGSMILGAIETDWMFSTTGDGNKKAKCNESRKTKEKI